MRCVFVATSHRGGTELCSTVASDEALQRSLVGQEDVVGCADVAEAYQGLVSQTEEEKGEKRNTRRRSGADIQAGAERNGRARQKSKQSQPDHRGGKQKDLHTSV